MGWVAFLIKTILDWILATLLPKAVTYARGWFAKKERAEEQEKTNEAVKEDVKNKTPRTEEMKKRELEDINS